MEAQCPTARVAGREPKGAGWGHPASSDITELNSPRTSPFEHVAWHAPDLRRVDSITSEYLGPPYFLRDTRRYVK
jgi:hypothetical protein